MKTKRSRLLLRIGFAAIGLCLVGVVLPMQIAFINVGQEFGAYGQYNRVLHVAQSMPEFTVVRHGVSRELTWDHILHVEEFTITVRDADGGVGEIRFYKGTAEMNQKDRERLREIVREKHRLAVAAGKK